MTQARSFSRRRLHHAPRASIALALILAGSSAPAHAQLHPGDTVRLSIDGRELRRGAFERLDSTSIYLRDQGQPSATRTTFDEIAHADLLLGHQHAGGRMIAWGGAIGGGLGAALGLASTLRAPGRSSVSNRAVATLLNAGVGAALGIAAGATASGREEEVWRSIDLRQLASAPAPITAGDSPSLSQPLADTLRRRRIPGIAAAGDTIRLFGARAELVHGILVRADSASLFVNPMNSADTVAYPREGFSRAEVRRGDRRRGVISLAKGTAIGAAVGASLVALGVALDDHHSEGLSVIYGLFLGTVSLATGTAIGGVVALTYTDLWIPFDPVTFRMLPAAM